jgi:hypothetical protein
VFLVEYADIHEEEFYQFCYVTASGAVRGVSRAFEIIDRTDDDDLVIINPSETGYTSFSSNGVSPQKWQQMLQGQVGSVILTYCYCTVGLRTTKKSFCLLILHILSSINQIKIYLQPAFYFFRNHSINNAV